MFHQIQNKLHKFVQRGLDNHIRLAVTGLSRSGKTAFITSLVDQLLHIRKDEANHLNLFAPARHHQILSVIPAFPVLLPFLPSLTLIPYQFLFLMLLFHSVPKLQIILSLLLFIKII